MKHFTTTLLKCLTGTLLFFFITGSVQAQLIEGAFVTTWRTTAADESITIPTIFEGYAYTVDWGDGTTDAIEYDGDATHTYATAGDYQVSIVGDFPRIFFQKTSVQAEKIISIDQWGDNVWQSMGGAFYKCTNVVLLATDVPNLSEVEDMSNMFTQARKLTGDLSQWDVSNVTNMNTLFDGATIFTSDLSQWNVGKVTNMKQMFAYSAAPSDEGGIEDWNVSSVESMNSMFYANTYNGDLSAWDISAMQNLGSVFDYSNFSVENYNKILKGWSTLDEGETQIPTGLTMGSFRRTYCAVNARNTLINDYGWTITGDNHSSECSPVPTVTSLENIEEECNLTEVVEPTAVSYDGAVLTGTAADQLPITELGETTITWTYTDADGHTSTQNQAVLIEDVTAPVADVATLTTLTSQCSVSEPTAPTATDDCSGIITGTHELTFPITDQGEITIVWTFTDAAGNTSTQSQLIQIEDVTAPVADAASLEYLTDECSVSEPTAPTATDNCSGEITGTHELTFPITTPGETTIVWTFTDAVGNSSMQNQTILIEDVTAPVADAASLENLTDECSVSEPTAPTATDNCSGEITGTHALTFPITTQGETTIVWTFTDAAGNSSTQNQTILIEDVTAPVADAASLEYLTDECSVSEPTAPTATDNCSGEITGTHALTFPITTPGETTIVWTFIDAAGNSSTQNQTILIEDTTDPVPDVAALPNVVDLESVTLTAPTATDNCSGILVGTTETEFPITTSGLTDVEWLYEDGHGNATTQIQYVVIGEIPANDVCADAIAISIDQEVTGTIANALPEAQISDCSIEPFFEEEEELEPSEMWPGVWYSFQGTGEALTLNIDYKVGESFFSVMAGTCDDELVCIGSNLLEPSFSFETVAGEPYLIHVSESFGESDSFTFSLSTIPANTSCDVAETVTIGSEVNGTSIGLLEEEDAEAMWYHFVGSGEGVQIKTTSADFLPHVPVVYSEGCEGTEVDAELTDSQLDDNIILLKLLVDTELGVDYYIKVIPVEYLGSFLLEVLPAIPPTNDQCVGAVSVSCGDTITGSTEFATADDALAPACGSNSDIGKGVWYSFVGTGDQITLSTCNDDSFNTSLSVYSGACTTGLVCVAGNENGPSCPNYSSELTFISQLNTEYLILVDGYYDMDEDIDAVGEFSLEITCEEAPTPPTNDTCSDAMALTVYEQEAGTPTQGTNEGATAYLGVVECDQFVNANDVWYSFNSGYNTEIELTATFETAGYLFYALYESCGGEAVDCMSDYNSDEDDMDIPDTINEVTFEVASNTDYLIQVWNSSEAGTFTLILNDGDNTAPSITNSQDLAISRYATTADVLWDFEYEDDEGNDQRFELLSGEEDGSNGDDGAFFAINELTGELYVADPEAFQASDQSYFVMRVKLIDQGPGDLSDEVLFEIEVYDDQPPMLDDVTFAIDEEVSHMPSGFFEYVLLGSSPDEDDFTYTIVDGNDFNMFMIEDGKLIINEDGHDLGNPDFFFDYESQNQFVLDIKIQEDTDLALSAVGTITINLNDLNEYPVVHHATTLLNLNSPNGTSLGYLRIEDQDEGQTHTFSIYYDNSGGLFSIDATTGEVFVADASAMLSAGEVNYSIGVDVTDSGTPALKASNDFLIRVQGNPMSTVFEVSEDTEADDVVGQVVYDATATITYFHQERDYLSNGKDGIPFYIEFDGTIKVGDPSVLDYETQQSHQIFIDARNHDDATIPFIGLPITINLTNVNERPEFEQVEEYHYLTSSAKNGDEVLQVAATDPDGDDLTYTLDSEGFSIDPTTGVVIIQDVSKIPFFEKTYVEMTITATDGELEEITEPTVYLVINAAPTLAVTSMTIDENESAGTLIGTLSSDDVHGIKSYQIISGNDAGHFDLDEESGNLTFVGDTPFDYESAQSYELTVELTDNGPGELSATETLTIAVNDVNEFAPEVDFTISAVSEDAAIGTQVGSLEATDMDSFQSVGMSISAGNTDDAFEIDSEGNIKTKQLLDFETVSTYVLTIDATDDGSPVKTTKKEVTITVNNVNESPVITAIADQQATEGQALSFEVEASDEDANTSLSFSLDAKSTDEGMAISAAGKFSWTPEESNGGTSYTVTVTVSDGTLDSSTSFDVVVSEENVAPVLAAIADQEVTVGEELTFTASATDADLPANTLVFTLDDVSVEAGMSINAFTGVYSWTPSEDQVGTASVQVTVSDGTASASLEVSIDVDEDEDVVASVPELSSAVYPNPVTDIFQFSGDQPDEVLILDLNGKVMLHFGSPQLSYDISQIAPGVYTMRMRRGKRMTINKLIKK